MGMKARLPVSAAGVVLATAAIMRSLFELCRCVCSKKGKENKKVVFGSVDNAAGG